MTYNEARNLLERSSAKPVIGRDYYDKPGRLRRFLAQLGNPHEKLKIIIVGGTVGKGSTCYYIARTLQGKYVVGLTISPHLQSPRERIQVNDQLISKRAFAKLVANHIALARRFQLTYPEFLLGLAISHFASSRCEFAAVEVGLGGKYDPANALSPIATVITNIGSDHAYKLGTSPLQRLREKYGIARPGVPLITGVSQTSLKDWLRNKTQRDRVPLYFVPERSDDFRVNNFALAKYVLKILKVRRSSTLISPVVPGRFERITNKLIIDAAHNPDGLKALARLLNNLGISHKLVKADAGLDRRKIEQFLATVSGELVRARKTIVATGSVFAVGALRDKYRPID